MAVSTQFANLTRPGVFLQEETAGYRVLTIASHSAIYAIVSGTTGPYHEPTLVTNAVDFANQFGGSPSEAAIRLLFRNDPRAVVYAVRAALSPQFEIEVDAAVATNYTLTINGEDVTYAATAQDDTADIALGLIDAINISPIATTVTAFEAPTADSLRIRLDNPNPLTLTVTVESGGLTPAEITGTDLRASDYISAIERTFDIEEDWAQGFLICPEAFQRLNSSTDRLAVGLSMEALASDPAFDWVALIDTGATEYDTVAKIQTEGQRYATPQGHSSFYGPYVIDLENTLVPVSPAIAAIATTRYREQGFQQPPAGSTYPIKGVLDVARRFGNTEQSVLNPLGINLIRYLRNKGVVVWGMRTRASNPFYTFVHTRVIMNVLNGTLRAGFDDDLFTSIDGQGIQLARIEETAYSVCNRLWLGRALFGATPAEAFEVRCDFTNNLADDLEQGNIALEVWVAPAPAAEKLLVLTRRVAIGQVQASAAAGQAL